MARMVELAMNAGALGLRELQSATDHSLLELLGRAELGDSSSTERLRRFVRRFECRRLPKRVLVLPLYANEGHQDALVDAYFRPGEPEARFEWEARMEAEAERRFGRELDVVMYCPERRMQLKEARTLVRFPDASAYLNMRAKPEYQEARRHRRAGVADFRFIMSIRELP